MVLRIPIMPSPHCVNLANHVETRTRAHTHLLAPLGDGNSCQHSSITAGTENVAGFQ